MFEQEVMDWMLLIGRWVHITVAVTWIGTSIFFMWMDRSFVFNPNADRKGHVGDLWMVHGGGFYKVEKMLMGPTKVPETLHWFKWESYWTWISGMFLLLLTYYTGGGTYLIDSSIADISFPVAAFIGLFSIFGSWFIYDFIWERKFIRELPAFGHLLTTLWFIGMSYFLCNTLSGRAAYIHIGGMLGTWMAANVFMRIIPRQVLMVQSAKEGKPVNPEWGVNAKNRSTHNTYFTLPVIFIMLSNHFPGTYGHEQAALALILITLSGALIRQSFIVREKNKGAAKVAAFLGVMTLLATIVLTNESGLFKVNSKVRHEHITKRKIVLKDLSTNQVKKADEKTVSVPSFTRDIEGVVTFEGVPKQGRKLRLPAGCSNQYQGDIYSDEVIVKDGRLANVLIRISKGLEHFKIKRHVPKTPVTLDQKGCIYRPRLIAAVVGQEVEIINSDPIFHNVKSVTKNNKSFNLAMPKQGQKESHYFDKAELLLETKCSVHPWMSARIAVLDHPYFFVTKEDGRFQLKDVPAGTYTLEAWHEVYGVITKEIMIKENDNKPIIFNYKG